MTWRPGGLRAGKTWALEVKPEQFIFSKSPEEACNGAHAIIVLTEWDEFKSCPGVALWSRDVTIELLCCINISPRV